VSGLERTRGEQCASDLRLDQLMRGELAGDAERDTRAHVDGCAPCRARLAELEAARAKFRAAPPPLKRPAPARRWRWAAAGGVLAAAAAVLLYVGLEQPPGERSKGRSRFGLVVEHDGKQRRGRPGERVAPGDTLQFVYTSDARFYGAVLSVDGARHVSRYFPDGGEAAELLPGAQATVPRSTVLDETLGRETLFALDCDREVALAPLEAALAADASRLEAPGCRVERFEIEKLKR
jgi:hypothetical protein